MTPAKRAVSSRNCSELFATTTCMHPAWHQPVRVKSCCPALFAFIQCILDCPLMFSALGGETIRSTSVEAVHTQLRRTVPIRTTDSYYRKAFKWNFFKLKAPEWNVTESPMFRQVVVELLLELSRTTSPGWLQRQDRTKARPQLNCVTN